MTRRFSCLCWIAAACLFGWAESSHAQEEDEAGGEAESDETVETGEDDWPDEADGDETNEDRGPETRDDEPADDAELSPEDPVSEAPESSGTPRKWRRFWLGIGGTFELALLPGGNDLCKLSPEGKPQNDIGVYCTNPDGSDFPTREAPFENNTLIPGSSGAVNAGIAVGNVRVFLAADYAVTPSVLFGARFGYVFNAYTGDVAPGGYPWGVRNLHSELRLSYLFGPEPLVQTGFAPLVFLAAGASQYDARFRGYVSQLGVAGQHVVNLWVIGGPWFVSAGGGARYNFSTRTALTMAMRLNTAFADPAVLFTAGPEIGVSYGF